MATATLEHNNRAFAEISVPTDAGIDSHKVYIASGPFEPYVERLAFANTASVRDPLKVFKHWSHREFGYPDDGARYFVKVTDVIAGVESPLSKAPVLVVGRSTGLEAIPLVLARTSLPTSITDAAALGDFEVSVRDFEKARIRLDVVVPTGFLEISVETAPARTGPWESLAAPSPPAAGVVVLDKGLFRVPAGSAPTEIVVAVPRANFLRLRVREDAGGDKEVSQIDLERLLQRVSVA